jgi:hypothetical protein
VKWNPIKPFSKMDKPIAARNALKATSKDKAVVILDALAKEDKRLHSDN